MLASQAKSSLRPTQINKRSAQQARPCQKLSDGKLCVHEVSSRYTRRPPDKTARPARSLTSGAHNLLGCHPSGPPSQSQSQFLELDNSDDSDTDFRSLRRTAKETHLHVKWAHQKKVDPTKTGVTVLPRLVDTDTVFNVHPCYFENTMGNEAQKAAREAAQIKVRENAPEDEMVQFLQMHGLTGPVRVYAKAFLFQGIEDPATLVAFGDARLARVIQGAELDISDELKLREALRALR